MKSPAARIHSNTSPIHHQQQHQQQQPNVLKLYVRIGDKCVLLVPVERGKSVQWLAEEAARRYDKMTGLNVTVLSLKTEAGGALLNGDDPVDLVLNDGDRIVGDMVKWHLRPLPERYDLSLIHI